ncbi:MAG: ribosome silencing factor [Acholeplasmataceae bacterium]|nr:ribosome silencing factor [Acholeplasmataceae bacterium]
MEKLNRIIQTLEDLKVKDLAVYDFEKSSPFYDYFVICTTNERQGNAAINYVKKALLADEVKHVEGKGGSWVLIDAHDVIIHLFREEDRKFYGFDQRLLGVKRIK